MRVCVCAQREWYMTYIARWITCHPKNKTNNNNESSRNCKCFAETSLAQLSMQTHTHANTHRMNFPSIRARISPAFGTLVLGVGYFSCRLLQPVQFAVDARLVRVVLIGVSKIRKKEPTRLLWNRVGNSLLLRSCWIIFEKKKVLSANFFFPYFFSRTLLSSAVGVNFSPQRGCLEIHPLGCSRSVPLHPPVASISTTTTKPVLKSIFPNCLATRIIIVVRIACSKTTPNPYRNLLYYTIYHMYICYGYGLLRGNELLIL